MLFLRLLLNSNSLACNYKSTVRANENNFGIHIIPVTLKKQIENNSC